MINYDWNCRTVDAYPQDGDYTDVVYNVHWIVTGTSDYESVTYSATSIGTQVLDTSEITDFIPFDELTNEESVSWTKSTMGEEQVASIEASIESQIDDQINPTSVTLTIGDPE
tara:strand:+ start:84 stop:422 length:339 start_codon:yes stop_codon:yes gene_type:complete